MSASVCYCSYHRSYFEHTLKFNEDFRFYVRPCANPRHERAIVMLSLFWLFVTVGSGHGPVKYPAILCALIRE
jgi:hypothetical protein